LKCISIEKLLSIRYKFPLLVVDDACVLRVDQRHLVAVLDTRFKRMGVEEQTRGFVEDLDWLVGVDC
jgi:hypothetical protein